MNLVDLKQHVLIVPEIDSHIKVVMREAFGVNAMVSLCQHDPNTDAQDCFM